MTRFAYAQDLKPMDESISAAETSIASRKEEESVGLLLDAIIAPTMRTAKRWPPSLNRGGRRIEVSNTAVY